MVRYDLISPRERKDGKTHWVKVGAAFSRDQGGFSLVFDALPLPDKEGNVRLLMTEPKPREDGYSAPRPAAGGIDDEIPF
jgi:hypothetical protein